MALGAGKGLTRHASGFGMERMRENGPGAGSWVYIGSQPGRQDGNSGQEWTRGELDVTHTPGGSWRKACR